MYTQGLDQKSSQKNAPAKTESAENTAKFQARVDAENKIEPKDWMPDEYRKNLMTLWGQYLMQGYQAGLYDQKGLRARAKTYQEKYLPDYAN